MRGVEDGAPEAVLLTAAAAEAVRMQDGPWCFLGLWGGRPVFAVDCSAAEDPLPLLPEGMGAFTDLRQVAGLLPPGEASVLAHARGMMHWRTKHRFCGVCGAPCTPRSAGHAMACTACNAQHFPRTDPAVIMLVHQGDRALLGHNHRFPLVRMYSTLAGFVEPGESFEEAVAREVFEEAGVPRVRGLPLARHAGDLGALAFLLALLREQPALGVLVGDQHLHRVLQRRLGDRHGPRERMQDADLDGVCCKRMGCEGQCASGDGCGCSYGLEMSATMHGESSSTGLVRLAVRNQTAASLHANTVPHISAPRSCTSPATSTICSGTGGTS
jgi:8-oxo-dGTP pyrophosphatase MutT (NUDIX family)